jgi:hypothetical protein
MRQLFLYQMARAFQWTLEALVVAVKSLVTLSSTLIPMVKAKVNNQAMVPQNLAKRLKEPSSKLSLVNSVLAAS